MILLLAHVEIYDGEDYGLSYAAGLALYTHRAHTQTTHTLLKCHNVVM